MFKKKLTIVLPEKERKDCLLSLSHCTLGFNYLVKFNYNV